MIDLKIQLHIGILVGLILLVKVVGLISKLEIILQERDIIAKLMMRDYMNHNQLNTIVIQ